jgi:hypothetical protein
VLANKARAAGQVRSVSGQTIGPDGRPTLAYRVFEPSLRAYIDPVTGQPDPNFEPVNSAGMGTVYERAAQRAGYPRGSMVPPQDAARVNQIAQDIREEDARRAALGGGVGKYQSPITIPQAQDTRLPVGTTGPQVAGQTIPTTAQADRRLVLGTMVNQLKRIDDLLYILPSASEAMGKVPGATIAFRRKLPAYREGFASLDSAINQILASLSRTVQQNVGTQTELDAQRAMDTLAQIKTRLLDPFSGDTQESARARIAETKLYLDEILKTLPATPTPTANATGGPPDPNANPKINPDAEVPPPGVALWTSPSGKVFVNGKPVG